MSAWNARASSSNISLACSSYDSGAPTGRSGSSSVDSPCWRSGRRPRLDAGRIGHHAEQEVRAHERADHTAALLRRIMQEQGVYTAEHERDVNSVAVVKPAGRRQESAP